MMMMIWFTHLLNGMQHRGAARNKSINSRSNSANIGSRAGAVRGRSRSLDRELSPEDKEVVNFNNNK